MSGTQSDSALAGACNITLDSPRSLRQPNLVISFPYFSSSATWAFGQLINWKYCSGKMQRRYTVFIGPESDHWLCLSVTNSLTNWLPFSKLDFCEPGMWRWQLKTCWSCWWWETVYSVTFSIQFLTVLKSFSRLDSNSLTFLQLVKAVKTLTGGATWSIIYFDFACTTNFPFLFLMAPVQKYMRWADLVIGPESNHWELTNWLTHWLLYIKLDWCDLGMWR